MKTKSKFAVSCFALIAGFLLAEAVLWLFFPLPQNEEVLLQNNIPGVKKQVIYERNSFGFRSLSMHSKKKPPRTIRIICMGASTTDQPTQGTDDIWSAILEKELRKINSPRKIQIEVAAWGYGGLAVIDGLSYAQNNLLSFQPDIVVLFEGINNLCWRGGPGYVYTGLADSLANSLSNSGNIFNKIKKPAPWKALLRRFSQLYRRFEILEHKYELYDMKRKGTVLEWHSRNLPMLRQQYRDLPYVEKLKRKPDPIAEFSDSLFALVKFLKDSNIRVIVLGQPVLWKADMNSDEANALWFYVDTPSGPVRPSASWLEEEMSRYNNVQKEIADTFMVPYVDLDKKVPKNLQYFFDDCHFTDLGNVKVATEIFPVVQEQIEDIMNGKGS